MNGTGTLKTKGEYKKVAKQQHDLILELRTIIENKEAENGTLRTMLTRVAKGTHELRISEDGGEVQVRPLAIPVVLDNVYRRPGPDDGGNGRVA